MTPVMVFKLAIGATAETSMVEENEDLSWYHLGQMDLLRKIIGFLTEASQLRRRRISIRRKIRSPRRIPN